MNQEPRSVVICNRNSIKTDPTFETARQILQQSLTDFKRMSEALGLPVMAGPDAVGQMEAAVYDAPTQRFMVDMMGCDVRFKPDHFEIIIDVRGYNAEDIKITVYGNRVNVTATHREQGPGFEHEQSMERDYILPQNVRVDQLQANLSSDGILVLSAPWL